MHRAIRDKIEANPGLLEIPHRNIARWKARTRGPVPHYLEEWREILAGDWRDVAKFMVSDSDRATRLRQSSPFAGVLTPAERKAIYESFRT